MTQVTLNNGSVDSAGALALKTNGTTTAVTIDGSQNTTFAALANFSKGSSSGITIGDVSTNSNSVLRMQGTSAGKNWQIANNLNVAGIEFTPSTANGGTTFTTPAVVIDASGNLLVGTTTATGRLTVKSSADGYSGGGLFLQRQANTNGWSFLPATTNDLYLGYNTLDRGYFNNSTGAYVPVSDRRLKKNIADLSYGLNEILSLRSVSYNMNEQEDASVKTLGFIAQEVQEVLPESVFEMQGGMFGMDKSAIVPVLVKAIQEQQAQISSQAAAITTLTERITALEAK